MSTRDASVAVDACKRILRFYHFARSIEDPAVTRLVSDQLKHIANLLESELSNQPVGTPPLPLDHYCLDTSDPVYLNLPSGLAHDMLLYLLTTDGAPIEKKPTHLSETNSSP